MHMGQDSEERKKGNVNAELATLNLFEMAPSFPVAPSLESLLSYLCEKKGTSRDRTRKADWKGENLT